MVKEDIEDLREALDEIEDVIDIHSSGDAVLSALKNAQEFDLARFARWIATRPLPMRKAALARPPNRIYELNDRLVYVFGYGQRGDIVVKSVEGGDEQDVETTAPSELKDVTQELRTKRGLS